MAVLNDTLTITFKVDADDVEVIGAAIKALVRQLEEARGAAETYHTAWQDAVVYWKRSLSEAQWIGRRLASHLLEIELIDDEELSDWMNRYQWLDPRSERKIPDAPP